jgi:hypothetical protein
MKTKLIHPLWTHIPAAVAVAVQIVATIVVALTWRSLDSPFTYPPNLAYSVLGDAFGSIVFCIGIVALFVVNDERLERLETKKTFNFLALFDELFCGMIAGWVLCKLNYIAGWWPKASLTADLGVVVAITVFIVGAGVVVELARPWRRPKIDEQTVLLGSFGEKVEEAASAGEPWAYWESHRVLWLDAVLVFVSICQLGPAINAVLQGEMIGGLVYVAFAGVFALGYGGMSVSVNRDHVLVSFGWAKVGMVDLHIGDVRHVGVLSLADAGVVGFDKRDLRAERGQEAYFLLEDRGVQVVTASGKEYLIGSKTSERLAAAIQAAMEAGRSEEF